SVVEERLARHGHRRLELKRCAGVNSGPGESDIKRLLDKVVDAVERIVKVPKNALHSRQAGAGDIFQLDTHFSALITLNPASCRMMSNRLKSRARMFS